MEPSVHVLSEERNVCDDEQMEADFTRNVAPTFYKNKQKNLIKTPPETINPCIST